MRKTDCPDCVALLERMLARPGGDIPETELRTRKVWETLECQGAHDLVAWVEEIPKKSDS